MTRREMARALGRRGGLRRAARLSQPEKRRIASLGGQARARSLLFARRIEDNLLYARVVEELRGPTENVRSVNDMKSRLPGVYPDVN